MSTTTCPTCGHPLERRPRAAGEVTVGAVAALVEGADVLACPEGHHVAEPVADLADQLKRAVADDLVASERTRVRRRLRCGACQADLTIPGRRTTRSVSTRVDGLGVVRVTFDVPMLRCPACGTEQLPAEVATTDVPAAIELALAGDDA